MVGFLFVLSVAADNVDKLNRIILMSGSVSMIDWRLTKTTGWFSDVTQ